ncbi:MAG: hypothetical protein V7L05_25460 [Nostoc sp.]|uniref:hypothetical protein n=1 Tax=Nostoc sp. TaxID=1180 RepID=UPI002FFB9240
MLALFYQNFLEKYLNKAQLITLKMLVWLLQNQKQVKIEKLAATLPLPIQQNSRRGYNLESSQASPDRLVRLIFLIALAMTSAWLQGQKIKFQRQQSYVCRSQEQGKTEKQKY